MGDHDKRERYLQAFREDTDEITGEINRLRATHDARFLLDFLLAHAADLGQGLTHYGQGEYVNKEFNAAARLALEPPETIPRLAAESNQTERKQ